LDATQALAGLVGFVGFVRKGKGRALKKLRKLQGTGEMRWEGTNDQAGRWLGPGPDPRPGPREHPRPPPQTRREKGRPESGQVGIPSLPKG
jgi:hypothetical protein